ncbi:MAG: hypothetical protein E6312_08135 [Peptoniphilus grossensis]|uniref:hypothetical protein n=1 Tax=Peptoniphilus grossensis TaxID=1465756 RepID=UPI00290ACB83|nr:hypothetical protein [Peptoniphilus grossensis]MDU7152028.1 hypothetical protein [Peptoniphilus grossensis]
MCHKKKDSEEKFLDDTSISILDKCAYTSLFVLPILLIVGAFYGISYFIVNMTYNAELAKGVGILLSSIITVSGVFAGFYFNKKQTYKEIVTKERIEWLHKMQDNLSEYLKLTNSIMEKDIEKIVNEKEKEKAKLLIEEKKDKINKLYYEIIFNINHENDIVAYNTIKKYNSLVLGELEKIRVNLAIKEGVKLELVAVAGEEGELLFKIKDESESNKIKDLIKKEELKNILIAEDKDKNKNKDIDEKELQKEISLLRKEVSEEFTKIFNETWNRIKEEAD